MNADTKLDKIMNEKGFWSFDFFSFIPNNINTPVKFGNFEFITQKDGGCIDIYTRYLGDNPNFTWINDKSPGFYHKHYFSTKNINGFTYCKVARVWGGLNKNYTFTVSYFVHILEDCKKHRENNKNISYIKEEEIKNLKKNVKEYKLLWESSKKEAVNIIYNISYEDYMKEQIDLKHSKETKFILKVAPMITRLRDECTLLLDQLNEPSGPSKKTKEDFILAYKRFQGLYHSNKTYLSAIKYFKKGKTNE